MVATDNFSLASSILHGYKFEPTDEEVLYILSAFFKGKEDIFHNVPIHRVNIYESTPQQLSMEYNKGNEKEWFFITKRTRRSEGGTNMIRKDMEGGSWKAITKDKKIEAGDGFVGYKTPLSYYTGSVKGDWLMQEYSFDSDDHNKVDHALCKIYLTPKAAKRKAEEAENEKKKKRKITVEEEKALREVTDFLFAPEPQQQTCHQVSLDEINKMMNELINGSAPEQVVIPADNDVASDDDMVDLYELLEDNVEEKQDDGYEGLLIDNPHP